jgi:hypothetical protein
MTPEPQTSGQDTAKHEGFVALTLATVVRLQQAFLASVSAAQQQACLQAAGEMLDRTLPDDELKKELSRIPVEQQVSALIQARSRIAAIPPKFWRPSKTPPNALGMEHYAGYRAVDRVLKREADHFSKAWSVVYEWLGPVWARYPELEEQCSRLRQLDS